MMCDVVTFGEAMLRLAPPHCARLEQTHSLEVEIGGSELNVAVGVSQGWACLQPGFPRAGAIAAGGELVNKKDVAEKKYSVVVENASEVLGRGEKGGGRS